MVLAHSVTQCSKNVNVSVRTEINFHNLKKADREGMGTRDSFDYFEDVLIVKEYNGYYYSVLEALKILLFGLICGRKNIREIHEWAMQECIKANLEKEFGIKKIPCYYWLTCLLMFANTREKEVHNFKRQEVRKTTFIDCC